MRTLLTLGIFDDGDVLPTVVVMVMELPVEKDGRINLPLDWSLRDHFTWMREAGEQEYGRPAPDHALFWSANPEPES